MTGSNDVSVIAEYMDGGSR